MGWLSDLLKHYPAVEVAREEIALCEKQYTVLQNENTTLKEEVARLKAENAMLKRQIPTDNFVESSGALFKRKTDGTFEKIAYCPDCRRALSTMEPTYFQPNCSKCGFTAPFMADEIPKIIAELAP